MGDIPVTKPVIAEGDWSTGLLDCCGGDGFGKAGDSAGTTTCKEVGWHQDNCIQTICGCCGYAFILYYLKHVSSHTPKPLCGGLLIPALKGCGMTQYDCAFGQNLVIVAICGCLACPYFRCKLREKYGIKGNIVFDLLACCICGYLAQFQEFREAAMRESKFSTQVDGNNFGAEDGEPSSDLPVAVTMTPQ